MEMRRWYFFFRVNQIFSFIKKTVEKIKPEWYNCNCNCGVTVVSEKAKGLPVVIKGQF